MPPDSGKSAALSTRRSYRSAKRQRKANLQPMAIRVDRIDERLTALGKSAAKASLEAGLSKDAIRNIKRGATTHGRQDNIRRLAAALGCSVAYLTGDVDDIGEPPARGIEPDVIKPRFLPVRYEVGAGYWVAEADIQDWHGVGPVGPSPKYEGFDQWLEKVIGDSMDKKFEPGDYVHVVDAIQLGYAPRNGDYVVVVAREGGKMERSIKQVAIPGPGKVELWPRSHNAKWSTPVDLSRGNKDPSVLEVEIVGKVVGSYRETD